MTTAKASGRDKPDEMTKGLSTAAKIWIGVLAWLAIAVLLYAIFGSDGKNEEFKPQN